MNQNKSVIRYFLFLAIILSPSFAYAYLDPGSGNALIGLIIAGIAAALYFLKDIYFRVFGKQKLNSGKIVDEREPKISILSEGSQYWSTFEPIFTAFIKRQIPIYYYTLDIEDPALKYQNDFMKVKFLGYGNWAYAKASQIKSEILLATTPNIGTPGYPIKRPRKVIELIHVFHSYSNISMYKKGSLDEYDSVILIGAFQEKYIREIEAKRNLKTKNLIPLGLPYLDKLVNEKAGRKVETNTKTILIGSSWGSKGCLRSYGTGFIEQIALKDYHVIVRPHPQSYIAEKDLLEKSRKELQKYPNVEWDDHISPSGAMEKSDIMISDTSSIKFDFAFLYEKPVITLKIETQEMPGYEGEDQEEIWTEKVSYDIGFVIERNSMDQLQETIEFALTRFDKSKIRQLRDTAICNFGKAGEAIADYLSQHTQN